MTTITTRHKGNMLFEADIGRHRVLADVPIPIGGADRAPTPPQLFVFSLGACIAALVANYCAQKYIDMRDLSVDISYDKADKPNRLTDFRVVVHLPHAHVDDIATREAILRVARRCPVHETMLSQPRIAIQLAHESSPTLHEAPEIG